MSYVRPVKATICGSENQDCESRVLSECALERAGGLHAVMFKSEAKALGTIKSGMDLVFDLIPFNIPPGLQFVPNPYGGNLKDYNPSKLPYVALPKKNKDGKEEMPFLATYLVHLPMPADVYKGKVNERTTRHVCAECQGDDGGVPFGGTGCSEIVRTGGGGKSEGNYGGVVFYLKAKNVPWPNFWFTRTIDHFLIPTILPNSLMAWVLIKRKNNPNKNKDRLEKWNPNRVKMVSFSGKTIFVDKLGINVIKCAENVPRWPYN